jgi:uncharacterized protein (DUF2062 family)
MARLTLKRRIRDIWQKLSRIDARPDQVAAGFSIGIAAGFLPLNPSPIAVATVVAWLLKRNVIAAVAGATAAILYIPLLPLIWLAEYRLGKLILPVQHPLALDQARLWAHDSPHLQLVHYFVRSGRDSPGRCLLLVTGHDTTARKPVELRRRVRTGGDCRTHHSTAL